MNVKYDKLKEVIDDVIKKGYDTFLIGMAKGFDLKCFEILHLILLYFLVLNLFFLMI